MAIAYDSKSPGVEGTGVTSLTDGTSWTIAGSNRFLIAMVHSGGSVSQPNPSSVKWGGSGGTTLTIVGANTQYAAGTGYGKVSQYYLIAPTAQTSTLYCSWASAPDESYLCGISYTGVHQTSPLGTQATNTGNSTTATVDVGSATGELVVDSMSTFALNLTPDASQTVRHENDDIQGYWSGGMSEEAGATTVTMSWALGATEQWGIQGVPIKPWAAPTAALTGTATSSITEADIVTGGKTVILTVTGDTWIAAAGTPTFVGASVTSTTTGDGRTGDGALTVNWPASYTPTAGHMAVIVLYNDQGDGSTPADWTEVTGSPFGGGTEKLCVFYKLLAGGESAPSTTISGSGTNVSHSAGMVVYSGVSAIGAIGTAANGTGTTPACNAITTTADGSVVVALAGRGDNEVTGSQTFGGSATGVAERMDSGTSAGNDAQVSAADKTIATTGTSGAYSSTTSATDPWVCVLVELKPSTPFADQRAAIRNGLDSAQSEAAGWDAKVKGNIPVANVVRTSDTVVTITLQAQADYDITATETITATIPAAALDGATQIVATPTFTITATASGNVGSSTGTSTAAALSGSPGQSSGTGTASAVAGFIGAASGTSSAEALQGSIAQAGGTSAADASIGSVAQSDGVASANAVSGSIASAEGTSTGDAIGSATESTGQAAGTSTAVALSGSVAADAGTSTAQAWSGAVGVAAGSSVGAAIAGSIAAAAGTATADATSGSVAQSAGAAVASAWAGAIASASGTAAASAQSEEGSLAAASGTSTASAIAGAVAASAGTASGDAVSGGIGTSAGAATAAAVSGAVGTATGTSTASGQTETASVASAAGTSSVSALAGSIGESTGAATAAALSGAAAGAGAASGTSTVTALFGAVGSAAGSSTTEARVGSIAATAGTAIVLAFPGSIAQSSGSATGAATSGAVGRAAGIGTAAALWLPTSSTFSGAGTSEAVGLSLTAAPAPSSTIRPIGARIGISPADPTADRVGFGTIDDEAARIGRRVA